MYCVIKNTSTYWINLSRVVRPCYPYPMKYLNALNIISGIGPKKIKMLLGYFQEPEAIWRADLDSLKATKIGEKLAERIFFDKNALNPDEEWEKLEKDNIKILTPDSPNYPSLLKEIHNPPYILYARGKTELINSVSLLSIVGSRKYTSYGSQIAHNFSKDLANSGFGIVSGMALGIDSFAHQGALDSDNITFAVLGNGLDDSSIYPRNNFNLSRLIIENGAIISEYPVGTKAGPLTFPARNRIVAGLSLGTLVIEAGEESGALITAQMALDYDREVFSVPGSIFSSQSLGTNNLIKKGAKLVTGAKDILEEFDLFQNKEPEAKSPKNPSSENEKILLEILSSDPIHIDNLTKLSKLETADVSSTLSIMEIKGWTKNIGGQNYILL
jgi:DNA processing protein